MFLTIVLLMCCQLGPNRCLFQLLLRLVLPRYYHCWLIMIMIAIDSVGDVREDLLGGRQL